MYEIDMTVLSNQPIARDIYRMVIQCDDPCFFAAFQGGQFVQLRIPQAGELLLRRPFAVETVHPGERTFTIVYQLAGKGTRALVAAQAGSPISIVGPLGSPFHIANAQEIWLLGGGVGVAPLHSVAQAHPDRRYRSYVGFSNEAFIFDLSLLAAYGELVICTDDGSAGYDGYAVSAAMEALDRGERPDLILACGTGQMLAALGAAMEARGYPAPCLISMESRMGCGTGVCLTCNCKRKTADGGWQYQRSCVEGPVFPLEEVLFDEIR